MTIRPPVRRRFAGMARWTTGRVLAEVLRETTDTRMVEHHFAQLGALTAALHNQAAPGGRRRGSRGTRWIADGFMGEAPHWGPFWDHRSLSPAERRLMLDTRARLRAALARLEPAARPSTA